MEGKQGSKCEFNRKSPLGLYSTTLQTRTLALLSFLIEKGSARSSLITLLPTMWLLSSFLLRSQLNSLFKDSETLFFGSYIYFLQFTQKHKRLTDAILR